MRLSKLKLTIFATLLYPRIANAASSDQKTVQKNTPRVYSYIVTYDKNISSIASADAAMSLMEGYRQLDDAVFAGSASMGIEILRSITRSLFISWVIVGNHEIGGHGGILRAFGVKIIKYQITPFNGLTSFDARSFYILPVYKQIAIDTGGIQANYLLSENIKDSYMSSHSINLTYSIGYLVARLEQAGYIFATKFNDKDSIGNDIRNYVKRINSIYGNNYITKNKIVGYACLDLLDPFLFYFPYSAIMNRQLDKIPMINFGSVRYLPATRAILAPYGLEFGLVNHFVMDEKYIQLNLNYGSNPPFRSYGVGIKANNLVKFDCIALGLEAAYWHQPKMLTNRPLQEKCKQGGFGAVKFKLVLNETFKIVGAGGYKTAGFMEGMPLASSPIVRAGLNVAVKI